MRMDIAGIQWKAPKAEAAVAATGAFGALAKSGGKAAFGALKDWLIGERADPVALIGKAQDNPAYAEAIHADLAKPEITGDADIPRATIAITTALVPRMAEARSRVSAQTAEDPKQRVARTQDDLDALRGVSPA